MRDLRIDISDSLDLHTFLGLRPGGHAGLDDVSVEVALDTHAAPEQLTELREHVIGTSPVGHTRKAANPVEASIRPG